MIIRCEIFRGFVTSSILSLMFAFFLALASGIFSGKALWAEEESFPSRPIKVVVPFAAGGGSDVLARILLSGIDHEAISGQSLVVFNVGGAGGTIGSRRVKNSKPDGYEILALHDGIFTAKQFGKVNYGYESFVPIAATGRDGVVLAVRDDSPFAELKTLLETIRDEPETVVFGANLGAPSHLTGLLVEKGFDGAKFLEGVPIGWRHFSAGMSTLHHFRLPNTFALKKQVFVLLLVWAKSGTRLYPKQALHLSKVLM